MNGKNNLTAVPFTKPSISRVQVEIGLNNQFAIYTCKKEDTLSFQDKFFSKKVLELSEFSRLSGLTKVDFDQQGDKLIFSKKLPMGNGLLCCTYNDTHIRVQDIFSLDTHEDALDELSYHYDGSTFLLERFNWDEYYAGYTFYIFKEPEYLTSRPVGPQAEYNLIEELIRDREKYCLLTVRKNELDNIKNIYDKLYVENVDLNGKNIIYFFRKSISDYSRPQFQYITTNRLIYFYELAGVSGCYKINFYDIDGQKANLNIGKDYTITHYRKIGNDGQVQSVNISPVLLKQIESTSELNEQNVSALIIESLSAGKLFIKYRPHRNHVEVRTNIMKDLVSKENKVVCPYCGKSTKVLTTCTLCEKEGKSPYRFSNSFKPTIFTLEKNTIRGKAQCEKKHFTISDKSIKEETTVMDTKAFKCGNSSCGSLMPRITNIKKDHSIIVKNIYIPKDRDSTEDIGSKLNETIELILKNDHLGATNDMRFDQTGPTKVKTYIDNGETLNCTFFFDEEKSDQKFCPSFIDHLKYSSGIIITIESGIIPFSSRINVLMREIQNTYERIYADCTKEERDQIKELSHKIPIVFVYIPSDDCDNKKSFKAITDELYHFNIPNDLVVSRRNDIVLKYLDYELDDEDRSSEGGATYAENPKKYVGKFMEKYNKHLQYVNNNIFKEYVDPGIFNIYFNYIDKDNGINDYTQLIRWIVSYNQRSEE